LVMVVPMSHQTLELQWTSCEGATPIGSIQVDSHCGECNLNSIYDILSTHDSKHKLK